MKVLFISPEVSPFARTGGLGEVVGSLPLALQKMGLDIRILCPLHKCCKSLPIKILKRSVSLVSDSDRISSRIGVLKDESFAVPVYFLKNELLFNRDGIYADEKGNFKDNALRSFVLSNAATQIEKVVNWKPDILHSHDWMAASTSAYLNAKQEKKGKPKTQGSLLTIHNLEHQGVFPFSDFKKSGLPQKYWGINGFEHYGNLNLLKGGIQHADKISTVSPSYAKEIRTPLHGQNLDKSLQFRGADLIGILNGINENEWNPSMDPSVPHPIDPNSPCEGKQKCKNAIVKEFGLASSKEPIFGVVSRLYHQKGLDLLISILPTLVKNYRASFVILGSGSREQEEGFQKLADSFPEKVGVKIGFDESMARRIFAGSDFFVMPSRFEPCGLAQQYAMRYGSVPIARSTGGLSDTIIQRKKRSNKCNGYLFEEAEENDLLIAIKQALEDWKKKDTYRKIQKRAMLAPCSWEVAATKYAEVYSWILP